MAKVVPSGVLQLPDFAQINYNLKEKQKKEDLETAKYLSQFQQLGGSILDGDRELVQSLYDKVEDAWSSLAGNPMDPNLILKVNKAYSDYSRGHGTAMAVADHWRKINSEYNQDPTKYALSSGDFSSLSSDIRTNKRDSLDGLESYYSNLADLPFMRKRNFGSAEEWVNPNIVGWDKTRSSLDINGTGSITEAQRDEWFDSSWKTGVLLSEDSKRNAILSEAKRQNPQFLDRDDLTKEEINAILNDPGLSEKYLNDFYNRGKSIFDKSTSLDYITPYDRREDTRNYNLNYAKAAPKQNWMGEVQTSVTNDRAMVLLPQPIEYYPGTVVRGYGEDVGGKKYVYVSRKNEIGEEVEAAEEVTPEKFKILSAMISKEYQDPNFFRANLARAKFSLPTNASNENVSGFAESTPSPSSRQVENENAQNIKTIDQMRAARDPGDAKEFVINLMDKYPDAAKRSGIDPNNLNTGSIDLFAEEIQVDAYKKVENSQAREKVSAINESRSEEIKEYKDLTEVVSAVGRGVGINRNPGENSADFFKRLDKKMRAVRADTYTYMGTIASETDNKDNITFKRKMNKLGSSVDKAYRLYKNYLEAVKDLEEISR